MLVSSQIQREHQDRLSQPLPHPLYKASEDRLPWVSLEPTVLSTKKKKKNHLSTLLRVKGKLPHGPMHLPIALDLLIPDLLSNFLSFTHDLHVPFPLWIGE